MFQELKASGVDSDEFNQSGAGSVLQQMVAHGGNTQPPLFRAGMTSSVFLPPQFKFNDEVPEVKYTILTYHEEVDNCKPENLSNDSTANRVFSTIFQAYLKY